MCNIIYTFSFVVFVFSCQRRCKDLFTFDLWHIYPKEKGDLSIEREYIARDPKTNRLSWQENAHMECGPELNIEGAENLTGSLLVTYLNHAVSDGS